MPFKKIYVKNNNDKQSYNLYLINFIYHVTSSIYFCNYNFNKHDSVFIEFKNNKRHILTIIKPKNIYDLLQQIKNISTNQHGKYDRNKIDNPPFLVMKHIKYINDNYEFDMTKILKNIICCNYIISIEELLFFYDVCYTNNGKCKIHYFKQFVEHNIEYAFDDIKSNNITFFKNI